MDKLDVLKVIAEMWGIDVTQPSPIDLPIGRFKDLPRMFAALGYTEGAEVGVYDGSYSRWLFKHIPGLHLRCVDAWEPYAGYKDYGDDAFPKAYHATLENTAGRNVELLRGWSVDMAKTVEDGSLDFVFIDANHAYEYVVADIAAWSPKVKSGGIVSGHDYNDWSQTRRWAEMGVINAVRGWTASYKIEPWFDVSKNQWHCWMYVKD